MSKLRLRIFTVFGVLSMCTTNSLAQDFSSDSIAEMLAEMSKPYADTLIAQAHLKDVSDPYEVAQRAIHCRTAFKPGSFEEQDSQKFANARENWRKIEYITKFYSVLYGHSLIDLEASNLGLVPLKHSPDRYSRTRSMCAADYQVITSGLRSAGKEIYGPTWRSVRDDNRKGYRSTALLTGRLLDDYTWCLAAMKTASAAVVLNPLHFRIDPDQDQDGEAMFRIFEHVTEQEKFWHQELFGNSPTTDGQVVKQRMAADAQARFDADYASLDHDGYAMNIRMGVISTFFEQEIQSCAAKMKAYGGPGSASED